MGYNVRVWSKRFSNCSYALILSALVFSSLFIGLSFVSVVRGTDVFTSGWEDSGGSDYTDGGKWTSYFGSPAVTSSDQNTGSYGLATDASNDAVIVTGLSGSSPSNTRVYAKFSALPGSGGWCSFLRGIDSGWTRVYELFLNKWPS